MSLKTTIEQEIKQAMLNKDKDRLRALRAIKSQILLAETEKGNSGELSEEIELKLLTKAAKQRKDSIEIFEQQDRDDLAATEKSELVIIETFLPKQLSEQEIEVEVNIAIQLVGATGMQDMGKVMGAIMPKVKGKADGGLVKQLVQACLNN